MKKQFKTAISKYVGLCGFLFWIVYPPCYVRSDDKGTESAVGKTGQDVMCQNKWLGLIMISLGT